AAPRGRPGGGRRAGADPDRPPEPPPDPGRIPTPAEPRLMPPGGGADVGDRSPLGAGSVASCTAGGAPVGSRVAEEDRGFEPTPRGRTCRRHADPADARHRLAPRPDPRA